MKRTLLVVIDALTSRIVLDAFNDGLLPNLNRLAVRGLMRSECVSIFPSITPAATSSIITGRYPCDHGITGAYFYNTEEDRVNYFGTDFWPVLKESFSNYFEDFLVHLNHKVLKAETLFQTVERAGLHAACINYMVYRGDKSHSVNMPWLMKLWPGIAFSEEIQGPQTLFIGDFVSDRPQPDANSLSGPGGVFKRFGFQDQTTAEVLMAIAEDDKWPDFTLAYFPDNDFESHSVGPASAISTVQRVDEHLGQLIDSCGGLENFLARHAIIVLGDHSQSNLIADEQQRGIEVNDVLKGFDLVDAGAEWTDGDQLMACPNMRACQIYLRRGYLEQRDQIVARLLSDHRVDQVIWLDPRADDAQTDYHVATRDRGTLVFHRSTKEASQATDDFANHWNWIGDLTAIDANVTARRIVYGDYPNAMERISACFTCPDSGDLWATALPGYEFRLTGTSTHDAGSHGSLHALDSVTPLIVAGLPEGIEVPECVRTVDVVPLCKQILGI